MGRKKKTLPTAISDDMFVKAIRNRGAYVNEIAEELQISPYMVKEVLLRNKYLREVFMDTKEAILDRMEGALVNKALGKTGDGTDGNLLAMMFYLKCMGKDRGWIDSPQKKETSEDKPLHIKIVGITTGKENEKLEKAEIIECKLEKEKKPKALTEKTEEIIDVSFESSYNEFEEDSNKQFYGG